jgi:prepilin peptidase CpaA
MAVAGGACAIIILSVRQLMPAGALPGMIRAPFEEKAGVPYGVAIAVGAFVAAPASPFLANLLNQISSFN